MNAALAAAPTATDAITLPLVVTVACATVALLAIAVYVRRLRRTGRLTGVTAAASGVSATGILVSALLVGVALGSATGASASVAPVTTVVPAVQSPGVDAPVSGELSGFQLPTE